MGSWTLDGKIVNTEKKQLTLSIVDIQCHLKRSFSLLALTMSSACILCLLFVFVFGRSANAQNIFWVCFSPPHVCKYDSKVWMLFFFHMSTFVLCFLNSDTQDAGTLTLIKDVREAECKWTLGSWQQGWWREGMCTCSLEYYMDVRTW